MSSSTDIAPHQARLGEGPAPELIAAAFRREIDDTPILWPGLGLADLAHAIVLIENGIIPDGDGVTLLRLLLELQEIPLETLTLDPALEDATSNREAWLRRRDDAAGGWLGAGRARREPATTAYRLASRRRLLDLIEAGIDLGDALTGVADAHVTTIMPDYTYLQQAQPTSLAHYLLSFAYPIGRDMDRLRACFERVNLSAAGIGSINGSRLPIDRQRLAALLGFDGIIANTRDAMWQVDGPVEILGAIVTLALSLDRLAEDLQIWSTAEFGMVELADRHARTSFIMPQKKNPYALAYVRGVCATAIGSLVTMAAVGKSPSAQVDNRIFALGEVPRALDTARATVRLMAGVVRGLHFDTARMAAKAGEGWSYATDLAEAIMEHGRLSFRAAHRVVGTAIRAAIQRANTPARLSAADLDDAARAVLGHALELPPAVIDAVTDPAAIVATRTGIGGAAPERVREMIRDIHEHASAARLARNGARAHRRRRAASRHACRRARRGAPRYRVTAARKPVDLFSSRSPLDRAPGTPLGEP